jgi:phosphoribosyl-ATP pyrophosphohydrolase/phosphoribosyl-AMP cyclohydrolase
MEILNEIKFNKDGLIPVIVQDATTNEILMLAYANREALEKTLKTKQMHYFSRSRKKLWKKGETSGNIQKLKSMYIDCDNDTILVKVEQIGAACHTGNKTCFYRILKRGNWKEIK